MTHDDERRTWPEEDRRADSPTPDQPLDASEHGAPAGGSSWPEEPTARQDEPAWPDETRSQDATSSRPEEPSPMGADEPGAQAAEIESWPSREAEESAAPRDVEHGTAADSSVEAYPSDEPSSERVWPTEERSAPREVEAYPSRQPEPSDPAAAGGAAAHAVPESEATTGESTQCPRCGTENRPGLAFCRNCGQRLVAAGVSSTVERPGTPEGTMACPRCGTHNRAGVAFCQNCGANLRGTSPGYVPPAAAEERRPAEAPRARGAILGPVVLLLGLVGIVTAYLLPFLYGTGSLFERATDPNGHGVAFWEGYPEVGANLADQAYYGLTGPAPVLALLLLVLAIAGFVRARPGVLQTIGLVVALLWSVGLIVLFVVVEVMANWGGDVVGVLRALTPAGIIFFLASLIVLIGTLTRFARG